MGFVAAERAEGFALGRGLALGGLLLRSGRGAGVHDMSAGDTRIIDTPLPEIGRAGRSDIMGAMAARAGGPAADARRPGNLNLQTAP